MSSILTPFTGMECYTHRVIPGNAYVPNSPLPVIFVGGAFKFLDSSSDKDRSRVAALVAKRNGWLNGWVDEDAVYPFTHYHSTAHEALVVIRGGAHIRLGGQGKGSFQVWAASGDVLYIPAGVGHRRVEKNQQIFTVAGFYPQRQRWDLLRAGAKNIAEASERASRVPFPPFDMLYGRSGPLREHWY